jgi:NADPH-dependent curcumin reductase
MCSPREFRSAQIAIFWMLGRTGPDQQHDREAGMQIGRNRQVRLKSRPVGIPQSDHFEIVEGPVPDIADGQFLVQNMFLSVEPAMRGWVNASANYLQPVGIGEVMRAFATGRVIATRHKDFAEGDIVMGFMGWQDFAVSDGSNITRKVMELDLPISLSLGVLGQNGVTAYFGLLDLGQPRHGDTVVVSTAAGSVGSAVGQIAKLKGCRTVGVAGGPEKAALCREFFGFDAAIDYRGNVPIGEAIRLAAPAGVNVYFDNTAGPISDAIYPELAVGARVVICGTASIASWDPVPLGPRLERQILVKRARVSGLLVLDYQSRYEEAVSALAGWVRDGRLKYREEIVDGIEACPGSIADLYAGANLGKRIVRLG